MKRYMIVMDTMEKCYYFMQLKGFHPNECILIPASMCNMREKMFGYYNQVMNEEIKLFGISKDTFAKIYLGNQKAYKEDYCRTHGFVERELKSSSLANKELKIVKGYLKGNSIVIEDWWKKLVGEDWQTSAFHNPAAYNYCLNHQSEYSNHSQSVNWVLYGKIGGLGYLVNVNELEWPKNYKPEEDYIFVEKEIEE